MSAAGDRVDREPLVELRGIGKRFGGVHAVADVDLSLAAGEVVGLLGHNGAGKSTLMKVLSGALPADSGEIHVGGRLESIQSPRDARRLGIETVYQDLALADNLDVPANLFLGRELRTRWGALDEDAMERSTREVMERLLPGFAGLRRPLRELSGGQRQCVALARATHFRARVLVLDEPTAALGPGERAEVLRRISGLRDAGLGVFLVSHDLDDVFGVADRVAVMRAGRLVGTRHTAQATREEVLELIVAGA